MTAVSETKSRIEALKNLLLEEVSGELSTQDELREKLEKLDYTVNQSTISRDLRKLGAIKVTDPAGRTVYRMPDDIAVVAPPVAPSSLSSLVLNIRSNGSIIVIQTSPGSASLVARHLDHVRPGGILGTLAGDDTIFVAPASVRGANQTLKEIRASLDLV